MDDSAPQLQLPYYDMRRVNNGPSGARTVQVPTDYKKKAPVFLPKAGVPFYVQRQTQYEDFHHTPAWYHPPYEKRPTVPYINQGYSAEHINFPDYPTPSGLTTFY
jgi:hypothetical protein